MILASAIRLGRFLPAFVLMIVGVLCSFSLSFAADGDTIKVRPIEFGGAQVVGFKCPPPTVRYQKVLMNFKLRCPPGKPCGEWDYLYYVFIKKPGSTQRYEIMRYISPYGNGLSLGSGFTWTMDVTDFSPLLHDSVYIDANMHNPWDASVLQEDLELTFDFITGVPPRNVLSVQPLWDGNPQYGQPKSIEEFLVPMKGYIPQAAKGARLRVTQTGHGFGQDPDNCAEFCNKKQYIKINGERYFERDVWRETCGLNPVYPQGGTWVYSRSNWCPGAEVTPFDYELTPNIKPGDSLDIDMDMEAFTFPAGGKGTPPNYVITSYLFTYSAPNNSLDASLEKIISPTNDGFYSRLNPICGSPVIRIRNNGATPLTSLDITYGVRDGGVATYTWKGNLQFMEEREISLPPFDWGTWKGENIFEVELSNPNGKQDSYAPNNHGTAKFDIPPTYYSNFQINLKTNKFAADQYEWTLKNSNGTIIRQRSNLTDNTNYIDSLNLPDGCYEFRLVNKLHYGLDWWATRADLGSGSLSFSRDGRTIRNFSGDFGSEIYHQFRVAPKATAIASIDTLNFGTVPVGKSKQMSVDITPANQAGLIITGASVALANKGFKVLSFFPALDESGKKTLSFGEKITVIVEFAPTSDGAKSARLGVETNDELNPSVGVRLIATAGPVGVNEDIIAPEQLLSLEAIPNTITGESVVSFSVDSPSPVAASIVVINALGQEVSRIFNGTASSAIQHITINGSQFPAGMYRIALRALGRTEVTSVAIIH